MKNKILQIFLLSVILIVILSNNIFAEVNVDSGNGKDAINKNFSGTGWNLTDPTTGFRVSVVDIETAAPSVTEAATEVQNEPTTSIYGYYELALSARPNDEKPGMYEYNGAWYYTDGSSYYIWAQHYGINENGNDAPSDNVFWDNIGPYSPENRTVINYDPNAPTNPYSY